MGKHTIVLRAKRKLIRRKTVGASSAAWFALVAKNNFVFTLFSPPAAALSAARDMPYP